MSTPADYLAFLRQIGVRLWIDNGQLRYHARKGALSTEELARLRGMKDGIVAELKRVAATATDHWPRSRGAAADHAPLSFQQRWLLKLMAEHPNWKATLSYTFRLQGELNSATLEKALEGVLHKHGALRTRIVNVAGEARQQVVELERSGLAITKVLGESDAERQRNALVRIQEIAARQLDAAVAPTLAAQLLQVSPRDHFLVLLIHRLAADCLGIGQVLRDLWALYGEALRGGPSTLLERPGRYSDYAAWQHTTDAIWQAKHAAYWNERLAGAERIHWPVDEYAASVEPSTHGVLATAESSLGETLSARLRELARQTQTLPGLMMLAVYAASVSIWCGQRDFVMPFLIAGRASEHETTVGYFSHVAYVRVNFGNSSFIELLKQVSNEYYRAAVFRQDFGRSAAQRPELLRGTLCQWLSWHPAEVAGLGPGDLTRQPGLEIEKVRLQNLEELTNVPPAAVELEISFFEKAGNISALAIYRTDRFGGATLARLMRQLHSTVEQVIADPHARMPC